MTPQTTIPGGLTGSTPGTTAQPGTDCAHTQTQYSTDVRVLQPLDAALDLARRGMAVFPVWWPSPDGKCACPKGDCKRPGKHPITGNGFKNASTDPAQIARWWKVYPKANIGLATGAVSGLVVLDIDGPGGENAIAGLDMPITPMQRTGRTDGGRHVFFAHPGTPTPGGESIGGLKGLDIRGDGGYVVVAPSMHYSGTPYRWVVSLDTPLAPMPDWLRELREGKRNPAGGAGTETLPPGGGPDPQGDPLTAASDPPADLPRWDGMTDYERAEANLESLAAWRCNDRDSWYKVGMALQAGLGDDGLCLWDAWSQGSTKYDKQDLLRTWASFKQGGNGSGQVTLASLAHWAHEDNPSASPTGTRRNGNGSTPSHSGAAGTPAAAPPPGAQAPAPKPPKKRTTSADLVNFLASKGYSFRLDVRDDTVCVNGARISDVTRSQIRVLLRNHGFGKQLAFADDAMVDEAAKHPWHPVQAYLDGLPAWDGRAHIAQLATHINDVQNVFGLYLRKWLIGAIERAYHGTQNAVFVWDGAQDIGKSNLARWLCPLPDLFVPASINPDDKDCHLRAMRTWIWEIGELGATTRRADVEALKAFLTYETFTVRAPYGRFDLVKPALANFIGTVNDSAGIFSDPTGSRRYWACTLTRIDWSYVEHVDRTQLWAEALAAWRDGESWRLSATEAQQRSTINETYAVPDPIEDLLKKHFTLDPQNRYTWTSTADILTTLETNGLRGGNTRQNAMLLAATLKKMGFEKQEKTDPAQPGKGKQRGYLGVEK